MSNKTNQSVLVNETSSYYLKQYAALQFPGSVDNFGTKTPIHLLQQQEESEHSVSLREACDSDYDLDGAQFLFEGETYDSVTDLVKENLGLDDEESIQEYNKHPRFDPFIPYEELVDKKNADREDIRDIHDSHCLDTMADYVDMYSTASGYDTADDITVLLPSSSYETVGMAFTHQALKQYEKSIDNHLFRKHRCYAACGEGYGREAGDYYPIMNFIVMQGNSCWFRTLRISMSRSWNSLPTMKSLTFIANILTSCFELLISKSLKKTPLANAILVCTSFAPVTRKPSLTEAVSRFATAIMSWPSRKGRDTKFLILLTATVSPMN